MIKINKNYKNTKNKNNIESILNNYEERIELLELKNDLIIKCLKKLYSDEYFSVPNQLRKIVNPDDIEIIDFIMYE